MSVGSLKEAYEKIRHNGKRGEYTTKWSIKLPTMSGDLVADLLTTDHFDIAEEDDGRLFSTYEWDMIEFYQRLVNDKFPYS